MKKILFFFDSATPLLGEKKCMESIQKYALEHMLLYEYVDVANLSSEEIKQYIEIYGLIIPPMICDDESVVAYQLVYNIKQLQSYFHIPKYYTCLKDAILLYS